MIRLDASFQIRQQETPEGPLLRQRVDLAEGLSDDAQCAFCADKEA